MLYGQVLLTLAVILNIIAPVSSLGSDSHSSSFEASVTKLVHEIRNSSVDSPFEWSLSQLKRFV
jgi:hypothetical protein